jgi:hypothetical protein
MRAISLASTVAFSAPDLLSGTTAPAPAATAPATPAPTDAKPAKPAKPRKPVAAKPTTEAKPAPVAKPAPAADAEPAVRVIGTARTAATIANGAASFGGVLSDRDQAYLAFFASFAGAKRDKRVTVSDIANSGRRPAYNGSNKPHDAGVVTRLAKAGILTVEADGAAFTFTKRGRETKLIGA